MISALLTGLLVFSVTPYSEIQLDALYVGSVNTLNGESPLNARRVDVNGDGFTDLLFPDRVLFQEAGRFDADNAEALPGVELSPAVDEFGGRIYMRFPEGLKAFQYQEGAWETVLDVKIQWPKTLQPATTLEGESLENRSAEDSSETLEVSDENPVAFPPVFERFLHDLNADDVPELIFPLQDGLHVYAQREEEVHHFPALAIFPKTKLIPLEEALPISNLERGLSYPDQHLVFHCAIEGDVVILLTRQVQADSMVRYTEYRYRIVLNDDGISAELINTPAPSPAFSSFVQPCRLNPDDQIDYAGGNLDYTSTLALLTPVFSTEVMTSPSVRPHFYRMKSFVPHVMFSDVNQDGYLDMVMERTDITNGGLRETLNRFTTQRKFTHHVNVHYQQPDGRFSVEPEVGLKQVIKLDQTPIRLSEMFERYQAGKLVSVTGDFNGDGKNDCVMQVAPDSLALFYQGKNGFRQHTSVPIPIESYETFHVLDLNQDGISDLVLQGTAEHEGESAPRARVLLFQGDRRL